MVPDQQRLSIDERSNLVAYLDGELNDAESRRIATKLTQSLTARREVEALQKTWDLLDLLPKPKASEDFTARTMTVATQQPDNLVGTMATDIVRRIGVVLTCLALAAVLFGVGYFFVLRLLPNPTARLARDLPIAESLDEYRDVGTFRFLELLDQASEFN